jgi:outer membrane lipoprotein-sorting protein
MYNLSLFPEGRELTGKDIIRKVNDILNQQSAFSISRMTIQTSSGQLRTFEFRTWARDRGEKTLIRYTAPSRARGQAILMLNNADDIWMYFPRTKRVRKLATHAKRQKMQGSDFSYEDMGSGDIFISDFDAVRIDDDRYDNIPCYLVRLERLPSSTSSYIKLIMWVRRDDMFPLVVEYYDERHQGSLSKELFLEDIRVTQGIPTSMRMIMKNRMDLSETVMEMLTVDYSVDPGIEMFTERSLRE